MFKPSSFLLGACLLTFALAAQAFDPTPVRAKIASAEAPLTRGVGAASGDANIVRTERLKRLEAEREASFEVLSTCDGRFNSMQNVMRKQVSRAEWISGFGALAGIVGTVATCPHCAALAAGLAGMANPLQQTFRDNYDSPQDSQDAMFKLSAKIESELQAYSQLPPADVEDPATFESRLRKRLDSLLLATASCTFYSSKVLQISK